MQFIFEYIVKCSVSLGVVYLFYWLVLRRLTFYSWNRWFLLLFTFFSFLAPFINVSSFLNSNGMSYHRGFHSLPSFHPATSGILENNFAGNEILLSSWNIAALIIVSGIVILLIRFAFQLLAFKKIYQQATLVANDGIKLYQVNRDVIPFSFGRSIFINQKLFHSEAELSEIIKHEMVHVRQLHTMDILWGELLCIVNWFNPIAWLIRNAIRENLEYIADDGVLRDGACKKQYQYLLLKVSGNYYSDIAHSFNYSSLKKRIAMMNKIKTTRLQLVRFLLILPLLAGMLILFRSEVKSQVYGSEPIVNATTIQASIVTTDTIPRAPIKKVTVSKPLSPAPAKTSPDKTIHTHAKPVLATTNTTVTINTSKASNTQVSVNTIVSVKAGTDQSYQ